MAVKILIVDDELTARQELCEVVRDTGYECVGVGDAETALVKAQAETFDLCLTDIRMPGMSGIELLAKLAELSPETMTIVITAYGDVQTAIQALRLGACDYVLKPIIFDDILAKIRMLAEHRQLRQEVAALKRQLASHRTTPADLVGASKPMQDVAALIAKVAQTRSNVLITGESGTGKELVARAIHDRGEWAGEPFIPINCAAIPEALLESELFGHVKGAFTGADSNKDGLLKTAGEGTVFFDEVGDMPLGIQAKLLRAIQNRQVQPVGSLRQIPIEGRFLAATNKNLRDEVANHRFREDLYYRLAVVEIVVPPLRDRKQDIPALVQHLINKYTRILRKTCLGATSDALRALEQYDWKGNVRELENVIERAMILGDTEWVTEIDLPSTVGHHVESDAGIVDSDDLAAASERFERQHILRMIERVQGNKRLAAERLGISLSSLYRKLEPIDSRPGEASS
ncbi:MAG: sigma-54-dependent transcriptional regulator [Planctomycetota bacterium]